MNRYIRCPEPRELVTLERQTIVADGKPLVVDMQWFVRRLLGDPRFSANFDAMLTAVEILKAVREPQRAFGVGAVMVIPDAPHWELLCQVAKNPQGDATYKAQILDTNVEFAHAIISASVEPPALAVATG